MSEQLGTPAHQSLRDGKYARVEREARSLLAGPPPAAAVTARRCTGLVMADVEFTTDEAATSFLLSPPAIAEVTDDARFTGGNLVRARRDDLLTWLAGYGIEPNAG